MTMERRVVSPDGLVVRAGLPRDQPAVLALNDQALPHVNALSAQQWAWLLAEADYFRVAEQHGAIAAFVIAIRQGTSYWSDNYRWFSARYPAFLYLDRIVVAAGVRQRGIGRAVYGDLVASASGRWPRIALEVNLQPPNPGSITFHERMGFLRVGERRHSAGEVAMLVRELSASSPPSRE